LSNNEVHEGDIVVGADGAYSAVRQRMYEQLRAKNLLPKSDSEDLPFSCTCLVGQTNELDPEEFPCIKDPICLFRLTLGDNKPFTVGVILMM
jgi:2-polyprenyl-6-methoxyphenol hydroxylase-like FAD-dependent oxidoreductase